MLSATTVKRSKVTQDALNQLEITKNKNKFLKVLNKPIIYQLLEYLPKNNKDNQEAVSLYLADFAI